MLAFSLPFPFETIHLIPNPLSTKDLFIITQVFIGSIARTVAGLLMSTSLSLLYGGGLVREGKLFGNIS